MSPVYRSEALVASTGPTRGWGLLEEQLARLRHRRAMRLIPPAAKTDRFLDIGCGHEPLFLLGSYASQRVGLDQPATLGDPSRYRSRGIELVPWDVTRDAPLPFMDDSFDVVTLLAVLEHLPTGRLASILGDIARILAPGGTLILTTPAWWTPPLLSLLAKLRLLSRIEIGEHQATYRPEVVTSILIRAGFPPQGVTSGHFEFRMNSWFRATKLSR